MERSPGRLGELPGCLCFTNWHVRYDDGTGVLAYGIISTTSWAIVPDQIHRDMETRNGRKTDLSLPQMERRMMKLKDKEGWDMTVAANQDPYGAAGVGYAERWADLM